MAPTKKRTKKEKRAESCLLQEQLVCPHCKCPNDPEGFKIRMSGGTIKCIDCGEAFDYEVHVKKYYSTY